MIIKEKDFGNIDPTDLKMVLLCFYSLYQNGEVESFVEKGQWWIENGEFNDH
jgi:hypothetical protein